LTVEVTVRVTVSASVGGDVVVMGAVVVVPMVTVSVESEEAAVVVEPVIDVEADVEGVLEEMELISV
jgi:dissimilatory sulfite reductase (desulfoviridin) alpha/beta subunit